MFVSMTTGLVGLLLASSALAAPFYPHVDTQHPYTGPAIPNSDPGDQTLEGNGLGFPRLYQHPAVQPLPGATVTNNINVISLSYLPQGMTVHFQTSFGIDGEPCIWWGTVPDQLNNNTKGWTETYDRTPPCSLLDPTQCSQFFHNVQLWNLEPSTTYYYMIPGGNGTEPSPVQSFKSAPAVGQNEEFSVGIICDMGFTNAAGTHKQLVAEVSNGMAFAWHGGDISYADDYFEAMDPCTTDSGVCYAGAQSVTPVEYNNPDYLLPVPKNETDTTGGPFGGDSSTIYEVNWDIWQNWMNEVTQYVPYMVMPGNHEAACVEGDAPQGQVTALLVNDELPGTTAKSNVSYYTCPESQRNFTAYSHRFHMPGEETGGRANFWYSFDYGLAHFVSMDGETDYYKSPESPFIARIPENSTETFPMQNETKPPDSGPFGYINGSYKDNQNYEQYNWLKNDLESVDRSKTPWVFAMSHRPMHISPPAAYEVNIASAFEDLLIENGVDAYFAGHAHYYERTFPIGYNTTVDKSAIINNNTYITGNGKSVTHICSGQAGNIENLSVVKTAANFSAAINDTAFGLTKLTVYNASVASIEFVHGGDGKIFDYAYFTKASSK